MRAGSVIVDLAAETGGNCELTERGREVVESGVTIVGLDEPAVDDADAREPAAVAQRRRARRRCSSATAQLAPDWDDEIVAGACVTREAVVV